MDDFERSEDCWGVALRAVVVFVGVVALSAAFTGDEGERAADAAAATEVAQR